MLVTPGDSPPVVLFYLGLCGAVSPAMSLPGPVGVWPASRARSAATHTWSPSPSPSPNGIFLTCMSIWWACPLQYSNNFNYIFTIIHHTSKWMEAIPLSEISVAACAKVITFTWICRFGVPETITSDHGPKFTSNLWLQLCEMLNISHKQTTAYHPESNGAGFAHAPPWQHGPRNYPLNSLDSEHSRGKTLVFPQLRQFSVHKLSCQMNFYKMMNFQLTPLSKKLSKPCMFLPLLCLGTILAPTCPASCQPRCSSFPFVWVHWGSLVPPLQPLYDGPCTAAPAPSPSESGRGTRRSAISRLKACMAADATPGSPRRSGRPLGSCPGSLAATKRVSFSDPLVSSPSSSVAPPHGGPRTVFRPDEGVFARLGPAAPSQPPQTRYPSRQRAPPQRLDL
jgi:hypothetical protein